MRTRFLISAAVCTMGAAAASDVPARPGASVGPVPIRFTAHPVDSSVVDGYQVVVADINHDGRPDLLALSEELAWYESPRWQRHVIVARGEDPINAAVADLDGDGIPEIALAHGFSTRYAESAGSLTLLTHVGDPAGPWSRREIDRVPTSHRLRFVQVDGDAQPVLVNVPLIGAQSVAPDYRGTVPVLAYRPGAWTREVITEELHGVIHGMLVARWPGESYESVLSAGFEGVHRFHREQGRWVRERLVPGDPSAWPKSGASEIVVGRAGRARFLATIEPWHGNQVVVYREANGAWTRHVIDSTLVDGHTLVLGDFDGDGTDELVAGERQGRKSAYLYRLTNAKADTWTRMTLDDSRMAAAGCAVADLNADRRADVVCLEQARLTWYENRP
ncbi:MAG: VCBS repeat-containing protein [Gemmatimonadaceae bacterium]|nr:VCBS repeat-containing protein [Gemmatimonadaceae bacterium]